MQPFNEAEPPQVESTLSLGNRAFRGGNYATAIEHYLSALQAKPALAKLLAGNMDIARKKYRNERDKAERQQVAVCGWELSHNSAGRVYTLAQLYQTFADVEIIGSLFAGYGRELWEPIRTTTIPCHTFIVEEENRFLDQALALVAAHPYDIVHLAKPRISNIFIGLLYKLIWGAQVLVDIDDEELAFVGAQTPISIDDYLAANEKFPELKDLDGHDWTRIAVGLAKEFDGVTVSNPALQQRYGGQIIRHARDEKLYQPTPELKHKSREKFGIPQDKKVVLFFGTPRAHKGLLETAEAIAQLQRDDILFTIVGNFPDPALKDKLLEKQSVNYHFMGNQPFECIPDIVAISDICVLLQDPHSLVSQFQIPAKLSDALGMGIPVLATETKPLAEFMVTGAVLSISDTPLLKKLDVLLSDEYSHATTSAAARTAFTTQLAFCFNAPLLAETVQLIGNGKGPENFAAQYFTTADSSYAKAINYWAAELWPTNSKITTPTDAPPPKTKAAVVLTTDVVGQKQRVAVVVHYYYDAIWLDIKTKLKALPDCFDLFITAPLEKADLALKAVSTDFPKARFHFGPNTGMDVIPFLSLVPVLINEDYLAVCKLQTKKGDGDLAVIWRNLMLDALIGSTRNFCLAIDAFKKDETIGLIGPGALYQSGQNLMYDNAHNVSELLKATYQCNLPDTDWGFFAGTMFWIRVDTLGVLSKEAHFGHPFCNGDYQKDGKIEHALERYFGLLPRRHSQKVALLQPRVGQHNDCALLVCDTDTQIGQAHIGDVMRQMERLDSDRALIQNSQFFEPDFYLSQVPELVGTDVDLMTHYLLQGTHCGLLPCKHFTSRHEIAAFLNQKGDRCDPFIFFIEHKGDNENLLTLIRAHQENLFAEVPIPELTATEKELLSTYLSGGCLDDLLPKVQAMPLFRGVVLNLSLIDWAALSQKQRNKQRVSIIIPIYGHVALTQACLDSILAADTICDYEIICVDNGSGADIKALLKAYAAKDNRIKVISNKENYKFALGCNIGASKAEGEVLVFLNNDTTVTNGWLDTLVQPLQEKRVAAVQPKLLYPDRRIQNVGVVFAPNQTLGYPIYADFNDNKDCVNISRDYQAITAACMAIKASDFVQLKGFDPIFINGQEDIDLCLRLTKASGRVCRYQANAVVFHHESKTPGRGQYIAVNRTYFTQRWHNKIEADDFKHYAADNYKIVDWNQDSEERIKHGIGISRPNLEKKVNQ